MKSSKDSRMIPQNVVEWPVTLAFEHDRIALVVAESPEIRAREDPGPRDPYVLAESPRDVREHVLD